MVFDMLDRDAILGERQGLEAEIDGVWMSDGIPMGRSGGTMVRLVRRGRRGGHVDGL
jgi:hypothetical protein